MTDPEDTLARADTLTAREEASGGPTAMVGRLAAGLARQGRYIRWIAFSVVFDIALSLIVGVSVYYVSSNRSNAHTSCIAGNTFRTNDRALWNFVLTLPARPSETLPDRQTRLESAKKLNSYLDKTFKLRSCD